jgi:transcriptional regulator with XRE-family HTH domain
MANEIDRIKDHIKTYGVTAVARQTGLSTRTLTYIAKGDFFPSYTTLQALLGALDAEPPPSRGPGRPVAHRAP